MGTAEIVVFSIIGLAVVGLIIFWVILESKFIYRVRVKELVKGRKVIKDFRARPFTDADGVSWWRLAGEKDKIKRLIPLPPEEAIEINSKGKKVAECYRTEFGEVIWLKEDGDVKGIYELEILLKTPPEKLMKIENLGERKEKISIWKEETRDKWYKENNVIAPFHAINTKQRMIYFNNIRKAEERRNKFDWKQQVIPVVSLGVLALIIIAGMVFWGDLAKPAIDANAQALQLRQTDAEILALMKEIKTGQQRIDDMVHAISNQQPAPD